MSNSHGTLFIVPSDEEDEVTLYSPNPPADAGQAARRINWTGPQALSLPEGFSMAAEALQTWLNEKKSIGFRFDDKSTEAGGN